MRKRLDLESKLKEVRNNRIPLNQLMHEVQGVLNTPLSTQEAKRNNSKDLSNKQQNDFTFDYLDADKIFSITDIKKVCTTYRLRFIKTSYYKTKIPTKALQLIGVLEAKHNIKLEGLKIMASAKLIQYKSTEDCFLFAPIGNDYYYLINNWGNELSSLRKWVMWPIKRIENMIGSIILLSLIITFLTPIYLLLGGVSAQDYFIFFLFNFKWIAILALFYGIAFGKNFSIYNWQNKSYKT